MINKIAYKKTINKTRSRFCWLINKLKTTPSSRIPPLKTKEDLKNLILSFLLQEEVLLLAEKNKIQETKLKEQNGDQFVASLEFDSGSLGTYTSHWFSPGGWSVKLYGVGVTVEFNPLEKGVWFNTDFQENEIVPDEVDQKFKPGFYRQMKAFINMVNTGKLAWPAMDLGDSFKTMELTERFLNA